MTYAADLGMQLIRASEQGDVACTWLVNPIQLAGSGTISRAFTPK